MKYRKQRGGALVEFALVFPLFLTVLLAISQFGWLISNYMIMSDAALVGARMFASERGYATPYSDTKSAITSAMGILTNSLTVVTSVGGASCNSDTACASALGTMSVAPTAGTTVNVSLVYTFTPLFHGALGGLSSIMPSSLKINMSEVEQ